jgi:outer membrane receptor for ferrienterochelin and colicin
MRRQLIWALALVLATFGVATAQETTSGSLAGQVLDNQGAAVPGATVTITSNQGARTFVTDSNGKFFAPFLTPGKYTVKVELAGFSPVEQKGIDVRLGQRLDVNFSMKVGDIQEVVEVIGAAPTVDMSSTTTGGVLDSETLKKLPIGRNFTDALYLVPGVSSSGTLGKSNPSVGGASGLENNYVVDGVNISNSGYGAVGSYSIVFGSLGSGVTADFIKETQVKTGGFEAEYGQATGGVVNVVTNSGTNEFHGSVFGFFRPAGLESNYQQLQTTNGTVNIQGTENTDFGVTLGFPLMKDKVFFFGAFNPQYQTTTYTAPDGFPLASLGDVDQKRKIYSYAGKLTFQLSSNHRVDVSAFGDPSSGDNGPQRVSSLTKRTTASFSELSKYGGHNQAVKYDGILNRNWLVEASVAHAKNNIVELPSVNDWAVSDRTVVPNINTGGIGFYEQGNSGTNTQYQLKSTNIFEAAGNHQVRYGVSFEDIDYNNINQYTGPTFTLPNGVQTATGASIQVLPDPAFGQIFRVVRANLNSGRDTTQKYLGFFLQDTWQIGKRLTIRPGVRYDQQKLVGVLTEHKFDGNWAPRIGATYDLKGDGKAKVYASYGKFFTKIPNDLAARALSADAGVTRADYFDANLTQPVPDGVLAAGQTAHFVTAGLSPSDVDPKAGATYESEFAGGVEFEAARGLNLGVRYIHRTFPRVLEDIGSAAMVLYFTGDLNDVEYTLTNPHLNFPQTSTATLPGFGTGPVGAFEDPVHRYNSVEVTANKSFSNNWALVASYRWSKLSGNFEGFYRNDNGQSDPSISSLFDFPTNDPTYTAVGVPTYGFSGDIRYLGCTLGCDLLPNDRTHQAKLYTSYSLSNLNLGLGVNLGSGSPLTAFAANPAYDSSGEIPLAERGTGIDTLDSNLNPAGFRTRVDPDIRFDAHVDYTLKFGTQRLILLADVFNLFNRQVPTNYDTSTELSFQAPNPDTGTAKNPAGTLAAFSTPRQVRLGARFEW